MAATGISSGGHRTTHASLGVVVKIVLGILSGSALYYATAVVGTAQIPGAFVTHPIVLVLLAALAALSVAGGWRWPGVGLVAGGTIALIILFAVAQRIPWTSASQWLNPFESVGFGAVSGYPAMIAAILLTASTLRLASNRNR